MMKVVIMTWLFPRSMEGGVEQRSKGDGNLISKVWDEVLEERRGEVQGRWS